jgi:predicted DNA-binding transcriptional regulator AlpA
MLSTHLAHDPDAALTESQAADFLGLSVRTLQAWRWRGGGPKFCKLGRSVRYPRRELVAFQQSKTVASTTEVNTRSLSQ